SFARGISSPLQRVSVSLSEREDDDLPALRPVDLVHLRSLELGPRLTLKRQDDMKLVHGRCVDDLSAVSAYPDLVAEEELPRRPLQVGEADSVLLNLPLVVAKDPAIEPGLECRPSSFLRESLLPRRCLLLTRGRLVPVRVPTLAGARHEN